MKSIGSFCVLGRFLYLYILLLWGILGCNGEEYEDTEYTTTTSSTPAPSPTSPTSSSNPFVKNQIKPDHLRGARWELTVSRPINVFFTVEILDISQISTINSDFRLDVQMKQRWTEESLIVPPGLFEPSEPDSTQITTDGDVLDDIWTPDLYIPNSRRSEIKSVTKKQMSVLIFKNKTIVYVSNLLVILGCPMNFNWYPMDTQYCKLLLESYSYPATKVKFQWENQSAPIVIPKNFILRQFSLRMPLNTSVTEENRFGRSAVYSCLTVNFILQRQLGHHLIQVFMPTFLIVAFSWFSFWLGLDAIPGRVSLLVTCMLTLVTIYTGMKSDLPPVAYIKMMDIWMAGCLGFVFAAMSEFILVRYLANRHKNKGNQTGVEKTEPNPKRDRVEQMNTYNEFYRQLDQRKSHPRHMAWDVSTSGDFPYNLDGWHQGRKNRKVGQAWNLPTYYDDFYSRDPYPYAHSRFMEQNKTLRKNQQNRDNLADEAKPKPNWEAIDKISRFAFPFLFSCFCAVYWPILLLGG